LERREADDRVDGRRLARTIGPEKAEELTGCDFEREVVNRDDVPVPLDEVADTNGAVAVALEWSGRVYSTVGVAQ